MSLCLEKIGQKKASSPQPPHINQQLSPVSQERAFLLGAERLSRSADNVGFTDILLMHFPCST